MQIGDKIQAGLCVIERVEPDGNDEQSVRLYEVWLPQGFNGYDIHSAICHGMEDAREEAAWYSDVKNLSQCVKGGGCGCEIDEYDAPVIETPVAGSAEA